MKLTQMFGLACCAGWLAVIPALRASLVVPTDIPASTRLCTDYVMGGVGGMRWPDDWVTGPSTATISLGSGLTSTAPVKAYLYWFAVAPQKKDSSTGLPSMFGTGLDLTPAERIAFTKQMTVNGTVVPEANITLLGEGNHDNWPGALGSYAYRADVSAYVTSPNDSVTLSGFPKTCEGASLVVFYQDGNSNNNRNLYLFEGNDSNGPSTFDSDGWNANLSGFSYAGRTGAAKLILHLGDTQQTKDDGDVTLNGSLFLPFGNNFSGNTVPAANPGSAFDFNYVIRSGHETGGRLWDIMTYNNFEAWLPSAGPASVLMQSSAQSDFWNLVLAIVDLPSSGLAGDCDESAPEPGNRTPVSSCPAPLTIEASLTAPLPAVTLSVTVSDPEQDPMTVQWFFSPRPGAPQQLLRTDTVGAVSSQSLTLTFAGLAPQSANKITVLVSDNKPGHSPIVCDVGITTVEPAPPELVPGAELVVQAEESDGMGRVPDLHTYYFVQNPNTPVAPPGIIGWDNNSQTLATLLLAQAPEVGTTLPVGVHPLTIGLTDEALNSTSGFKNLRITRAPGNRAPVARPDYKTTRINQATTISILANDSDVDADPFAIVPGSVPAVSAQGGSLVVNGDGSISYTPVSMFTGVDTFSYSIVDTPSDGSPLSSTALVTINVIGQNTPPVASGDTFITNEDTAVQISFATLLTNDSDADGDPLTVSSTPYSSPSHGTISLNSTGWRYTPNADYSGSDSFTYEITDGFGGSATATVQINVTPVNDAPLAVDDSGSSAGEEVLIPILANDSDLDGGALSVTSLNYLGSTAQVQLNPNGTLVYLPGPTFVGTDLLTYTVGDGNGGSASATVRIVVRGGGDGTSVVATDDHFSVLEDGAPEGQLEMLIQSLLSNDSASSGTLALVSFTQPGHGSIGRQDIGLGDALYYTPAPGFFGVDVFTYTVSNGNGGVALATVTINVISVNDLVDALDDSVTVSEDSGAISIAVLANDSDVDPGDTLSLLSAEALGSGSVIVVGNQVQYTPAVNFSGLDYFQYTVLSSDGSTDVATVEVNVLPSNDAPTIPNAVEVTGVDQPITRPLGGNDVDLDPLTYALVSGTGPLHGTVTITGSEYTYTPAPGYVGTDAFSVEVTDGRGGRATAQITITVFAPPVAVPDLASTQQGEPVTVAVLLNDTDPDGQPSPLTVESTTTPLNGTVTINVGGTVTYSPSASFYGVDTFSYTITDGASASTSTVQITVNSPPQANNAAISTAQNTPYSGTLTGSDLDGGVLTFGPATVNTAHGLAVISANGAYTYTPVSGYSGPDSISFTVDDGQGGVTAIGTVVVTVLPGAGCDLYPIALHISNVNQTSVGGTLDIYSGANPGNFGWLSWVGPLNEPTLVTSLTVPGNSSTYVNPNNPNDHAVSVGDYVQGSTGVQNSSSIRARLDVLKTMDITVPVWDRVQGSGANTAYRVGAFARVRIVSYNLNQKKITATFLGLTQCGGGTPPPPVNRAPIANRDTATTNEDQPKTIAVLQNDIDPDADVLTVVSATNPSHGTVVVNPTGTVTYTPAANYSGTDSFQYTISDGSLTATARVNLTVCAANDAPVANDQARTTFRDVAVRGKVSGSDIDGDRLSFGPTGHRLTAHGAVDLTSAGSFVYVPQTGYVGSDSFTFQVSDGKGGTSTGTVTLNVVEPPTNPDCEIHPIVIHGDCFDKIKVGSEKEIEAGSSDGRFGWAGWEGIPTESKLCASLSERGDSGRYINPNNDDDHRISKGDWVYGLAGIKSTAAVRTKLDGLKNRDITVPIWNQVDRSGGNVRYKVLKFARVRLLSYQSGNVNRIKVKFLGYDDCGPTSGNLAPIAKCDNARTAKNTSILVDVLRNDSDPNGDPLTLISVTTPSSGSAQIVSGKIRYTPASQFVGRATFSYTVSDGHGGSSATSVMITVTSPDLGGDGSGCSNGWDSDDDDEESCRRTDD